MKQSNWHFRVLITPQAIFCTTTTVKLVNAKWCTTLWYIGVLWGIHESTQMYYIVQFGVRLLYTYDLFPLLVSISWNNFTKNIHIFWRLHWYDMIADLKTACGYQHPYRIMYQYNVAYAQRTLYVGHHLKETIFLITISKLWF